MSLLRAISCVFPAFALAAPSLSAGPIILEGAINQDGTICSRSTVPASWNLSAFDRYGHRADRGRGALSL